MSLKVYDYRSDIVNMLVTPQIRCRFLKMAVGQFNAGHTHDLGPGDISHSPGPRGVRDRRAERGAGSGTDVHRPDRPVPHGTQRRRRRGDHVLSVTPHIQPTHTLWNEDGTKQPPRFTAAGAYDEQPDRTTPTAELAARQSAAAATVAQAAAGAATVQQEQLARYRQALAADDEAAAHEARNEMWEALSALFSRTMELAAAWNDFAARSVDPAVADRSAP